jgi:hypothetical protein
LDTGNGQALTPARGTLLRVRRGSKIAALATGATLAAFAVSAIDVSGAAPSLLTRALAVAAVPLALAMAIRAAAAIWRGPELLPFPVEYATLCRGADAAEVRAVARVRGALGGAGHVHRERLVFPAAAWLVAAGVLGLVAASATQGPEWRLGLELLALGLAARALFPARPFWYREHRDGAVVVYPASVTAYVCLRARRAGNA